MIAWRLLAFAAAYLVWHLALVANERFVTWYIEDVTVPVAAVVARVYLVDAGVRAQGPRIVAEGGGLHVREGCEGLDVLGLWVAAMLVAGLGRRGRLLGLTIGTLIVFGLNQLRLLHLLWLYREQRSWFADAHGLWWPLVLVAAVLGLFLLWQRRYEPAPAAA